MRFSGNIEDYPDGIVLAIDKPYRWTSADVVRKVKYAAKRHFGKKNLKVGHAGTLDPLATGILLVCIGPATKKAEELQASPKTYIAGVSFGATTPSFDREKDIDKVCPLDGVSLEALNDVLPSFIGEQEQVAPLFSAKSVDGVRAYETARRLLKESQRNGVEFDHSAAELLQTNRINIYDLKVLDWLSSPPEAGGFGPSLALIPPTSWAPPAIKRGCLGSSPQEAGGFGPSLALIPPTSWAPPAIKRGCLGSSPTASCGDDWISGEGSGDEPARSESDALLRAHGGAGMFAQQIIREQGAEGSGDVPRYEHTRNGRINVADISGYNLPTAMIEVHCSKGTYIRSLARDLGEALGSGAFMSSLRRTGNGGFTIQQAITLDEALRLLD
ncbi:MAG: hypothetical protein MJY48_03140 [Bacteroidales bacterium]|nr:hypothetical protein [Bacteroidales bacterium]